MPFISFGPMVDGIFGGGYIKAIVSVAVSTGAGVSSGCGMIGGSYRGRTANVGRTEEPVRNTGQIGIVTGRYDPELAAAFGAELQG